MKINYTTSCSKTQLSNIRTFITQQLAPLQLSAIEKNQLVLAIDEACANAIIHGNLCNHQRTLQIELEINTSEIIIEIFDIGNYRPNEMNFMPRDFIDDCIKNKRKGGLGLQLMHRIMDNVRYYSRGEVNVCALHKKITINKP